MCDVIYSMMSILFVMSVVIVVSMLLVMLVYSVSSMMIVSVSMRLVCILLRFVWLDSMVYVLSVDVC